MERRYVSIWFSHLRTDWFTLRQPELKNIPFVLRTSVHGRMMITAANATAEEGGIVSGMVLADARAITPGLKVIDDKPDLPEKLLKRLGEWCIRFTPVVAVDLPDGLLLDATGCTHLWGSDQSYLADIERKLSMRGYGIRIAIADTPGVAWGVARFGKDKRVIPVGQHIEALMPLPPEAFRLEPETIERLHKLGLHQVKQFIRMPRTSLRKRFGQHFLTRLDRTLGYELEIIDPVVPVEQYEERLHCLDPIVNSTGIEIALEKLLTALCSRLAHDQKGLRTAILKCYRTDGKTVSVDVGTNRPSHSVMHLFKLFELKLQQIEPGLGIELFILIAPSIEDYLPQQEKMWGEGGGLDDNRLSELIDRLAGRISMANIHRYLPDEHYWPERSFKSATCLGEELSTYWRNDKQRPVHVLPAPERIEVTAPIPDYPPMLFRYKGKLHQIIRADGPERIEQEWWLQQGQHRDYYRVEDEEGKRYWLFRLGHYHEKKYQWFLHGFFS
jgi:protein ImuB